MFFLCANDWTCEFLPLMQLHFKENILKTYFHFFFFNELKTLIECSLFVSFPHLFSSFVVFWMLFEKFVRHFVCKNVNSRSKYDLYYSGDYPFGTQPFLIFLRLTRTYKGWEMLIFRKILRTCQTNDLHCLLVIFLLYLTTGTCK